MRTFPEFVLLARQNSAKEFRTGDLKLAQRFINKFFKINPPLDVLILDGFPLREVESVPETEIWLVNINNEITAIFKMTFL
jgi:hypothetical protein